jgi:small subunit ribosomal protein S4
MKLFLKGAKCFSEKCPVEKRNFAPGQHGKDKKTKIVGYGLQLREKQKAKRMFFVQEGQFRNYFEKASKTKGVTGEVLLQQLERRLDNIVYRMGFAMSRRQARQLVRHGHISVNGRKVNIPSFQVSVGQEVSVRERSREMAGLQMAKEFNSHQTPPTWMNIDREAYKGSVTQIPKRAEISVPVNEQLIVELYSK